LNSKWHPEVESRSDHYLNGFAICLAAVEGLRKAVDVVGYENLDGTAVQQAVETIRDYDPGIGIGYTWTPDDHQGLHAMKWYERMEDGRLIPLTGEWDPVPALPEEQRTNEWWQQKL